MMRCAILASVLAAAACQSLNPLTTTDLTNGFSERAIEVNEAYRAEINAQILVNILRARDRQGRQYTTLSELKLTPGVTATNKGAFSGLGLGNNAGDPWVTLAGDRTVQDRSNLEFAISPNARGADGSSIFHSPISPSEFLLYESSDWPEDILEALLVNKVSKIFSSAAASGAVERILTSDQSFSVFVAEDDLTLCFSSEECELKLPPRPPATPSGGQSNPTPTPSAGVPRIVVNPTATTVQVIAPDQRADATKKDVLLETDGAYVMCRAERPSIPLEIEGSSQAPRLHRMLHCSRFELASSVCEEANPDGSCKKAVALDVSLFYVTSRGGADRAGVYAVQLNSIDDAIYTIGRSLRGDGGSELDDQTNCAGITGAMTCSSISVAFESDPDSDESPPPNVTLFSVSSTSTLGNGRLESCGRRFAARVVYGGEVHFAGPPQSFTPTHRGDCYSPERSSTALTLLAELIELRRVPASLTPTSFFLRD